MGHGVLLENTATCLNMGSEVFSVLNMKVTIFSDVMPCSLVEKYQCYGATCCLCLER